MGVGATLSGSEDVLQGGSPLVRSIEELKIHRGLKFKLSILGGCSLPLKNAPPTSQSAELSRAAATPCEPSEVGRQWACRAPSSLSHHPQEALETQDFP